MGSAPENVTESVEQILIQNGHEPSDPDWLWDRQKKQCPKCYSLHGGTAKECTTCGWIPHTLSG